MKKNVQFKPSLGKTIFEGRFTQANAKTTGFTKLPNQPTVAWRNFLLLLFGLPMALPFAAQAQVSGTVFQDYNANGTRQTVTPLIEAGVAGITVTAYLPNGSSVVTTTNASGVYAFTAAQIASGTQVRLEFSGFSAGMFDGFNGGTQSQSSERFVTAGGSANAVNLGVNVPENYCQTNPPVALTKYLPGAGSSVINSVTTIPYDGPYSANTITNPPTDLNSKTDITGAIWGLAYANSTGSLFSASFMKRHAAFGPAGTGVIYRTTNANNPSISATTPLIDFNAIGIATGINPHQTSNYLVDAINGGNNPFDAVGKISFGDLDISTNQKYLFVSNLFDRKIYRITIDADNNPATSPTAADVVMVGDFSGVVAVNTPNCTSGVFRISGLEFHNGKLYVGGVCTAENSTTNTAADRANLRAYVYEISSPETAPVVNTTPLVNMPLDFTRGQVAVTGGAPTRSQWNVWVNDWNGPNGPFGSFRDYPQPLLSDIVF